MLTQSDIKKLRIELVKDFATKKDLEVYVTKRDLQNMTDEIIKTITEMFSDVLERIDKALNKLEEHDKDIDNHERRIEKVEEKVFGVLQTCCHK